jgi:ABC-2 type transport system permease protein
MKLLSVFRKSMREQFRDLLTLSLTLILAPFFVFVFWLMLSGGSTVYEVLVINSDRGSTDATWNAGDQLIEVLNEARYENGKSILDVKQATNRRDAEKKLQDRDAALLIIIPENFSALLESSGSTEKPSLEIVGDLTNPYYSISAVLTNAAFGSYLQRLSGQPSPIDIKERALGDSAARTEFETYVPPLLIMSVVLLIYQAAMTVAREIEAGTVRRLQLTPVTSFDLMGGIMLSQIVIGVIGVILTFISALALGFHSEGSLWIAILIGIVVSFSMVGVGLLVACFSRTVARAFMIANFPLFLMFFFTGVFMPVSVPLFTIGDRKIGLFDSLPPTHASVALNKVLSLGAGLDGIVYELVVMSVLSLIYFAAGVWLFRRMHLRYQ